MHSIGEFLKKIRNTRTKDLFLRSAVREAIKKYISIDIPVEMISLTSSTILLKDMSQIMRSEIFVKKEILLKEINSTQDMRRITDIR